MEGLKVKHTAGPWRYDNGCIFSKERRLSIATVNILGSIETEPEELANAHLIASAPELLEACKVLLSEFLEAQKDNESWTEGDSGSWTDSIRQARQAIAKAEGR